MHMMSQSRKCSHVWRKIAYYCKLHQQMQIADWYTREIRVLHQQMQIAAWYTREIRV
ncbi:hypothetical protein HOLleu_23495 [Holothuria leucospilota]|uniref:Uncharacterized protein n=1 Tax=Holothuria leucospilota TaxID=206669 RepID=A0A9Q1H5P9_HOLLE|nr:hypothetical protein HOLleu_23495 [Holothuria leucospilota]